MILAMILATLLALSVDAHAEPINHPDGVQVWFPDGWPVKASGDELEVKHPEGDVVFMVRVVEGSGLDTAMEGLKSTLAGEGITDIEPTGDPEKGEVNGMTSMTHLASAKKGEDTLDVGVIVVEISDAKALILFGITHEDGFAGNQELLNKIGGSVKKVEPVEEDEDTEEEEEDED